MVLPLCNFLIALPLMAHCCLQGQGHSSQALKGNMSPIVGALHPAGLLVLTLDESSDFVFSNIWGFQKVHLNICISVKHSCIMFPM